MRGRCRQQGLAVLSRCMMRDDWTGTEPEGGSAVSGPPHIARLHRFVSLLSLCFFPTSLAVTESRNSGPARLVVRLDTSEVFLQRSRSTNACRLLTASRSVGNVRHTGD